MNMESCGIYLFDEFCYLLSVSQYHPWNGKKSKINSRVHNKFDLNLLEICIIISMREKRKCCIFCILQLIPKLPIRYLNTQHTHECTKPFKKFCHLQRLWQLLSSVSFIVHGRSFCCCTSSYLKGHILISFHLQI